MLCKIKRMGGGLPEESRLVSLPKAEPEINVLLCDMQINRKNGYAYEISDVKIGNTALEQQIIGCRPSIDELNHIAGFVRKFNGNDLDFLNIVMTAQNPKNATDFINAMHNYSDYAVHTNVNNLKELGEKIAFNFDRVDPDSPLGRCVNYEEYGESFHDAHEGAFVNGQYIIPPFVPNEVYDGVSLPWNGERNKNLLLAVCVTTYEKMQECETPTGIWLELPVTQYAIDRTAHRLGAEEISDCYMYNAESSEELTFDFRFFEPNASLYEVNALAEVLSSYSNSAITEKLEAVLEYEGQNVQTLPDIINVAYNLDCYDYDPEITCEEDFPSDYYEDENLTKMIAVNGKFTDYGFVTRNDTPMEQVYEPPEPEQEQGMQMV